MDLEELIAVARGDSPADLILANAKIVNTLTAEIEDGNVSIFHGRIAGVGRYDKARQVIDLDGKYVAPGLFNGHVHIESSLLHPAEYARAVVPRGVSTIVTDLHEIANVTGLDGVRFIMEITRGLPMDFHFMAPSCVPATHFETAGAELGPEELRPSLRWRDIIGLGEMMNFPGVLSRQPDVMQKLALFKNRPVDGHAPSLSGKDLNAYIASGAGSDHESTSFEEGREKLRRGMYLMIREGSSEKNLDDLLPLVTDRTYRRCLFVVDDRTCADLLREGDVDAVVRKAISKGLDPIRAIQMVTINPAEYFRLQRLGAVAPGFAANLVVIDDLFKFNAEMVFHRGNMVARRGELLSPLPRKTEPTLTRTVNAKPFGLEDLKLPFTGEKLPVIEAVPGQIITKRVDIEPLVEDGFVAPDIKRDLLKLVVIERHRATGNIGRGLVRGFGLKRGALASSISHDSHNIIIVGTDDGEIIAAFSEIEKMQGGLVAVAGGKVLKSLALPVAGLLSEEPLETVVFKLEELERTASDLGCTLPSPFAVLSFLALPVIPDLRLTDKGLVDVSAFRLID